MSAKNKLRGNQLEREVVDMAKALGLEAKRAYASNGQSLGLTDDVDVTIDYLDINWLEDGKHFKCHSLDVKKLKIQCKRKKKLPDYLVLDKLGSTYDVVVFRQDGKPLTHYAMLKLETLLELIK